MNNSTVPPALTLFVAFPLDGDEPESPASFPPLFYVAVLGTYPGVPDTAFAACPDEFTSTPPALGAGGSPPSTTPADRPFAAPLAIWVVGG